MTHVPGDSRSGSPPTAVPLDSPQTHLEFKHVRGLVIGGAIIVAMLLWLFWHFFTKQVQFAIRQQADWGHTLVIPLIAGYLIYFKRHRLATAAFKTTWIGLVPIVLGTAWYMLCWLGPAQLLHHNLQGAGLSLTLFGIVLLFCGFRAPAVIWFALLYLCVFGQTISNRLMDIVTFRMQDITARGSYVFLDVIGLDIERSGNILTVWNDGVAKPLNIAEACSGMRMLMAFFALGVVMAYTGFKRYWQRVALVLLGIPIAIFVNILRVGTLAILSLYDTDFAAGDFHTFVGLLWLVPAFLMYLGLMWVLRHVIIEQDTPPAVPATTHAQQAPSRSESP